MSQFGFAFANVPVLQAGLSAAADNCAYRPLGNLPKIPLSEM